MIYKKNEMIEDEKILNFYRIKQEDIGIKLDESQMIRCLDEFKRIYRNRPIRDNIGGIGPNPSAWLFLTAKLLNPDLIIESGVWKGHSSWLLRQACPDSRVHAFDINLNHLLHREKTINYHEKDWSSHHFKNIDPARSLLFFDDHLNQARRIKESFDRGFQFLIFDDNTPVDKLERAGLPPLPTIQMLFNPDIAFGDSFKWNTKKRKTYTYTYQESDTFGAKDLIDKYFIFPGTYCFLSFIRLKNKNTRNNQGD